LTQDNLVRRFGNKFEEQNMQANRTATPKTIRRKSEILKAHTTPKSAAPKPIAKKTARSIRQIVPPQIENILERVSYGIVAFNAQMNYIYVNARGGKMLVRKRWEEKFHRHAISNRLNLRSEGRSHRNKLHQE
jgi:hypothetical protein